MSYKFTRPETLERILVRRGAESDVAHSVAIKYGGTAMPHDDLIGVVQREAGVALHSHLDEAMFAWSVTARNYWPKAALEVVLTIPLVILWATRRGKGGFL